MGIVTIIWLAMSGGVIIAARLSTITREYFLFFLKKFGVTKPIFVKKKIKIGNSKIKPDDKTEALKRDI